MRILSSVALAATAGGLVQADDWPQWRGPNRDGRSAETGVISKSWEDAPPKLLWKVEGMGGGFSSVSVAKGRIYTTGNLEGGQGVVAVDAAKGTVLWSTILTDSVPKHGYDGARCVPTVDGDHLYVVTSNGAVACLTTGGEVKWKHDFQEWGGRMMSGWGFSESPLVDGDLVVCTPGGKEAMMVALDKKSGEVKWKTEVPDDLGPKGQDGAGYGSIVISNGAGVKQYVQMTGKGVIGVRASDGKFLWCYNKVANGTANIPTPVVAGDYVFASTGYGTGSALLRLKKAGSGVEAEEEYFMKPKDLQNHHGGMILHKGHIYAGHGHNDGRPICVEVRSGDVTWGPEKGPGHGSAGITYVDGHLIYRYQSGHVALVEATDSGFKLKGSFMPEHQERESWAHPVVSDGKLYLREQNVLMCYGL